MIMPRNGVPGGVSLLAHLIFIMSLITRVIGDSPLSHLRCQLPQRGSHWRVGQAAQPERSFILPETEVLRCPDSRHLNKCYCSEAAFLGNSALYFAAYMLSAVSSELPGLPKPLPLGEVALRSNDGEGKPGVTKPPQSDKQALRQSDAIAMPAHLCQHPCPLSHLR